MKKPDPRVLLCFAICFSTLGVIIETTWVLASVFALAAVIARFAGARLLPVILKLRGFLYVILFIALIQSLLQGTGSALVHIGKLRVLTIAGITAGANTLLRIAIVTVSAAVFTATTSRRMIQGLIQLKIPYEFAFMALVALRFIPVFSEEFRDCITAIQLRGVDIKKIALRKKLKFYVSLLTPVVYGAMDKAQKLSYAMELRAFRAHPGRTSRFVLKLRAADYLCIAAALVFTAAMLAVYYIFLKGR